MSQYKRFDAIQVSTSLHDFIVEEVLPGLSLDTADFWQGVSDIVSDLQPINAQLLAKREQLQAQIDQWHVQHQGNFDFSTYKAFLKEIGYLAPVPDDFAITTDSVDAEIATMAGPQLVVPIMNARFALNAVNARWGSLYDALYGTDVISEENGAEKGKVYNPVRGDKVIQYAKAFLDETLPLATGQHKDASAYRIEQDTLVASVNGEDVRLAQPDALVGFTGDKHAPTSIMLVHNGLHVEMRFDADSPIAKLDQAGMSDIHLEAALTTIMDCEDSVAAVDAEDKVVAYKNWLGLIQGNLTESISKNGKTFTRNMHADRTISGLNGEEVTLKGRSLMFIRNVGHLMQNNAILLSDGSEVYEGIIDAIMTSLISTHDLNNQGAINNSKTNGIYIVKPKMHGPEEVAFANTLFDRVEQLLKLPANTIKMGIMDEERRTSVNLKACIAAAKTRVVFINTGF